jgi:cytochrome c oxidase subunit IV
MTGGIMTTKNSTQISSEHKMYVRFAAMIFTSMIVMYAVTYVNTFSLDHVQWSETRLFMTLLMGATMSLVMLLFMLGMYKNVKLNVAILICAVSLLVAATYLVRSQATVQDTSYMQAMVPHHSIAILTSENSDISDHRVCELAVEIIEAQRREIAEMQWLINDIEQNGTVKNAEIAASRPVPDFEGTSSRKCS